MALFPAFAHRGKGRVLLVRAPCTQLNSTMLSFSIGDIDRCDGKLKKCVAGETGRFCLADACLSKEELGALRLVLA